MPITIADLTVNFSHVDRNSLLEEWRWSIGDAKLPILITAMGNAILQDSHEGSVWLLDTGTGEVRQIAASVNELHELLADRDFVYSEFLVEDFIGLREAGKVLAESQVYGYAKPPVLGGSFDAENLVPTDIKVHFSLSGQICRQVRDLPPGTQISGVTIE
jgi:hypothetical protein